MYILDLMIIVLIWYITLTVFSMGVVLVYFGYNKIMELWRKWNDNQD